MKSEYHLHERVCCCCVETRVGKPRSMAVHHIVGASLLKGSLCFHHDTQALHCYLAHRGRNELTFGSISKLWKHLLSVAAEALALPRPKEERVELTGSWIAHHSCQVEHLVTYPLHHLCHLCALLPGCNFDQH